MIFTGNMNGLSKYIISALCCLLLCNVGLAQDTLRIMTFNIHYGSDTTLDALGEYIKQYNPDIVALQEVDVKTNRQSVPWTIGVNMPNQLAGKTDMLYAFGRAIDHPSGGFYGNALLSKYDIVSTEVIPLPRTGGQIEQRALLVAHINVRGRDVCVACTHLSYEDEVNRRIQMKKVKRIVNKEKGRVKILAGDFNADPMEKLVQPILRHWTDALDGSGTFASMPGSWFKRYKYDYIMYYDRYDNIRVINSFVVCEPAYSDHCAGIADIVILK